jgi:GxxExxY protein
MGNNLLIYKDECYLIQGVVFEVYKEMGCGFLEAVYQECLDKEMILQKIPYVPQKEIGLMYKGEILKQKYKPDFICYDKIIIELKATTEITNEYRAQVFNYLKATKYKLGLLINFGHYPKVQIERIVI